MELSQYADLFFMIGALVGMVLMLAFYRFWLSGAPLTKGRVIFFTILSVMAVSGIGAGLYFKSTQVTIEAKATR